MALKQEFQQIVEKQLAVWQEQTKSYQERLTSAGTDARANLEKAVAGLRDNTEQAKNSWARFNRRARVLGRICNQPRKKPSLSSRRGGPTR